MGANGHVKSDCVCVHDFCREGYCSGLPEAAMEAKRTAMTAQSARAAAEQKFNKCGTFLQNLYSFTQPFPIVFLPSIIYIEIFFK